MEGPFGIRRRGRKAVINITPLIDVMFLLLIFFMVSSTFRDFFGIDITLPQASTRDEQTQQDYEIIVTDDGRFFFDQQEVTRDQLRNSLVRLIRRDPGVTLILRADEDARFQDVISAIDITRAVGGEHLVIPTRLQEHIDSASEG